MIRRLRTRHRRTLTTLAIALPVFTALALTRRADLPPRVAIPQALAAEPLALEGEALLVAGFAELGATARFAPATGGGGVLELSARRPLSAPDLVLYASRMDSADPLPPDAVLVGAFPGRGTRTYAIEPGVRRVVLYSVGHGSVVAGGVLGGAD